MTPARAARGTASATWCVNALRRRRWSGDPQRFDTGRVHLPFGVPHIVGRLHAQPNPGPIAEQLAQANRNGGRDRFALFQYVVKVLPRNPQQPRDVGLGPPGRRNDGLAQQFAGMGRTAVRVADGGVLGHGGPSNHPTLGGSTAPPWNRFTFCRFIRLQTLITCNNLYRIASA